MKSTERIGHVAVDVDGPVLRVTMDRPETRNAIDPDLVHGLHEAIDRAVEERLHAFVLRGAGETFSSGADLAHVQSIVDERDALATFVSSIAGVAERLEREPVVSVAVVEGDALAGGCELLLACDVVVADEKARIGDRHQEYGLLPGAGGAVRLSRRLAPSRARYLLLTGEIINGRQAADWGLVTFAVPKESLEPTLRQIEQRLSGRSGDALRQAKRVATGVAERDFDDAIAFERDVFLDHMGSSADVREGLDAFGSARTPRFRAHQNGIGKDRS